jgi:hypothetical protein
MQTCGTPLDWAEKSLLGNDVVLVDGYGRQKHSVKEDIPSEVCLERFLPSLEAFEAEACDSFERVPGAIVVELMCARTAVGDDVCRSGDGVEGDLWLGHRVLPCCDDRGGAGEVAKEGGRRAADGTTCSQLVNDDQSGGNGRFLLGARGVCKR